VKDKTVDLRVPLKLRCKPRVDTANDQFLAGSFEEGRLGAGEIDDLVRPMKWADFGEAPCWLRMARKKEL